MSISSYYSFARRYLIVSTLIVLFSLPSFAGKIIHVPADQPTIQGGIDAALNGDTVLVSPGTYKENISFNGKAIKVASQDGPAVTIIDGQQLGTVVTFTGGETRKSVLRGFTIQNGSPGGIFNSGGSPTIAANVITSNSNCGSGTAIRSTLGGPRIQENIISTNSTTCGFGQAVYLDSDSADEVVGNVIAFNLGDGLALYYSTGQVTVTGNTIANNEGLGLDVEPFGTGAVPTVVQNLIAENRGIGFRWQDPPITVVNNTIVENLTSGCCSDASEVEGFLSAQTVFENNLLLGTAIAPVLACDEYDSNPVFKNNNVFGTQGPAYWGQCPDLTNSNGNISADPLLVGPFSNNFHLQSGSPLVNAGDNSAPALLARDFDGDKRILAKTVDIGVDEYSPKTTLTLSSYSLQYAQEDVGQTSDPQTVTLSNNGNSDVTLNLIATGSDFTQTNNCGSSLVAGSSCKINVSFAPVGGGQRNSVLGIFTNATSNPQTVNLAGTGIPPIVQLDTGFIYFYNQTVGTRGQQTDNLTNVGQVPLNITGFAMTGDADFTQTNNCPVAPATLAAGAFCTITVYYTPAGVAFGESATLYIYDNATPSPQAVSISGNSVSAGFPSLQPSSLNFPDTVIGNGSGPLYSTLTNTGTGPLGSISVVSGGDFPETSDCPDTLAPGASCTIGVTFSPSYANLEQGNVEIFNDSATLGLLGVSGTGVAPVPTISSLSVSNAAAGSSQLTITINGTGFFYQSQVGWNGAYFNVYPSSATQINFGVTADQLASPGAAQVTVQNPAPGGVSNAATFTIYTPLNYGVKSIPYRYRKITGTNLDLFYFNSGFITSPFPIQFGGGSYTTLDVDAGGNLSVVTSGGEFNQLLPSPNVSTVIAPFWGNLYPFGTGDDNNVFWEVTGTAPDRELVIEWRDVSYCCDSSGLYTVKFQVVFAENKPEILFNYADTVFGGPYASNDNGATATVGVQVTPTVAEQYSYDTPSLSNKSSLLWYPSSPDVTLSTSSLDFGYHFIGTRSTIQIVTVTNGGIAPLQIANVAIDNHDFAEEDNCSRVLKTGQTCTINVAFAPSAPGLESGTLTITDNGAGGPQTVSLSGIGATSQVVVFPTLLKFGNVPVGQTRILPITLANAANKTMTIEQIVTKPNVFSQTNNCGPALNPGSACTINVTFAPVQKGSVKGGLGLGINGKPVKAKAELVGTGN